MKGITIATFISKNEIENEAFYEFTEYLNKFIDTEIIIFSNKQIKKNNIKVLVTPQMTKYKRIQILLNEAKFDDILCLDNDITPNKINILKFIKLCSSKEYSIAWGKIKARKIKGIVPKLIDIDKNLSHDYIRPTLWKLNVGISLPGQIFMINKKYLKNKLPNVDTVYDDLMIGATVRENKYPVFYTKDVLGYESPKQSIKELIKQRIRWAKGLSETIIYNKRNKILPYILLHGFSFNLLWIPIYIIIFVLYKANLILGLLVSILLAIFLAGKSFAKMIWALLYMIIFPCIYFIWGIALIFNLIKINNNNELNKRRKNLKFYFKKQVSMLKKNLKCD